MKTFIIVLNCVIAFLLVLSLAFNVMTLYGWELKEKSADMPATEETASAESSETPTTLPNKDKRPCVQVSVTEDENDCDEHLELLIYKDDNLKITYITSESSLDGPIHKFKIKNTSPKALTILFCNLYINGREVYISGLTCENLLSGTETIEDLVLMNKDWEHFTATPEQVSFKIKVVSDTSRLDLYETDRITLTF